MGEVCLLQSFVEGHKQRDGHPVIPEKALINHMIRRQDPDDFLIVLDVFNRKPLDPGGKCLLLTRDILVGKKSAHVEEQNCSAQEEDGYAEWEIIPHSGCTRRMAFLVSCTVHFSAAFS